MHAAMQIPTNNPCLAWKIIQQNVIDVKMCSKNACGRNTCIKNALKELHKQDRKQ